MEVRFSPEQEAQLSRVASHAGMDIELFVKEAALHRVAERNRFSAALREGMAQADRGELIDDEVRRWLEQQERTGCVRWIAAKKAIIWLPAQRERPD